MLETRPCLLPKIIEILLRARCHKSLLVCKMHGFCSARAYASSLSLKFILYDGNTLVKFLCSRTRASPLEKKFLTIPRLELIGCVLLSNLMKSCLESLSRTFLNIDVYCWSDSADCIYWINNNLKIWKEFLQSQVIKIHDNLPGIKWLHCPGSLNPADIPSRGIDICKDNFLQLRLNGSEFLSYCKDM